MIVDLPPETRLTGDADTKGDVEAGVEPRSDSERLRQHR